MNPVQRHPGKTNHRQSLARPANSPPKPTNSARRNMRQGLSYRQC